MVALPIQVVANLLGQATAEAAKFQLICVMAEKIWVVVAGVGFHQIVDAYSKALIQVCIQHIS